ncbi:MAG TPA: hypothetical protein VGU73_03865 [Acidimicrobiia bacterium]|nr:hypothetical protein [Acidimicrobiia bacterium]
MTRRAALAAACPDNSSAALFLDDAAPFKMPSAQGLATQEPGAARRR